MTQLVLLSALLCSLVYSIRVFSFPRTVPRSRIKTELWDSQDVESANINTIFSVPRNRCYQVSAAFFPLVGGPEFLPLHVSLILKNCPRNNDESKHTIQIAPEQEESSSREESCHRFDFLPVNATDPTTLQKLIMMKRIPGCVRYTASCNATFNRPYFEVNLGVTNTTLSLEDVQKFCDRYQRSSGELHLVTNNCFSFALELLKLLSPRTVT